MEPIREDDNEFLASLEERIVKAVEIVNALRKENSALVAKLEAANGETQAAETALAESTQENARLSKELDSMRAERKHVRTRIEKLLGQMDLLSAS
jgi:predicted nuclease with TOPRIM domain